MMKVRLCAVGTLLALMTGCQARSAGDLARISPQTYKNQVLAVLGTPSAAECKDGKETLYYNLLDTNGARQQYFVLLDEGWVQAYGKAPEQPAADCGK